MHPLGPLDEVETPKDRVVFRPKATLWYLVPVALFGLGVIVGVPALLFSVLGLADLALIWGPALGMVVAGYLWRLGRPSWVVDFRDKTLQRRALLGGSRWGFDQIAAVALKKEPGRFGELHARVGGGDGKLWHLYVYTLRPAGGRAEAHRLARRSAVATPYGLPDEPTDAERSASVGGPVETLESTYDPRPVLVTTDYELVDRWADELCQRIGVPRFNLAALG